MNFKNKTVDAKIERVLSDMSCNKRSIRIDKIEKCPIDTKYSLSKWKTRLLQAKSGNPPSKMEKKTAKSLLKFRRPLGSRLRTWNNPESNPHTA
jgi:hypothetical protein